MFERALSSAKDNADQFKQSMKLWADAALTKQRTHQPLIVFHVSVTYTIIVKDKPVQLYLSLGLKHC